MTLYEDDMSHFPSKLLLSLAFCWTGEKEKTMKEICVMWTPCLRSSHPTLATGRPQELGFLQDHRPGGFGGWSDDPAARL
jgi:hypothetical protein